MKLEILHDAKYLTARERLTGYVASRKGELAVIYCASETVPGSDNMGGEDLMLQGSTASILSLMSMLIEDIAKEIDMSPEEVATILLEAQATDYGRKPSSIEKSLLEAAHYSIAKGLRDLVKESKAKELSREKLVAALEFAWKLSEEDK